MKAAVESAHSSRSSELLDLEQSLEDLVADLISEQPKKGKTGRQTKGKRTKSGYGTRQMQRTYTELCRQTLRPIARYVKAIHSGVVMKDLVEVMALMVRPLIKKTKEVGLQKEARRLQSFDVVLQQIQRARSAKITKEQAASLFEVYWPVHETFDLDMRGHSLAVANLLSFYRKLKRSPISAAEIRKIFAIGISSLTMIRKSSLEDLSSLSGIAIDRVREIRSLAREFQLEWYME